MSDSREIIKEILLNGSSEEKKELFKFNRQTDKAKICKKFKLFSRSCYIRYFKDKSAPFHDDFAMDMVESYYGENVMETAYRGSSKTSLKKLFDVFVLLNDADEHRKYIKVLTKDGKNSKQIVTDVYNLIVEVRDIYGNPFEKEGDIKHEETMNSFTMRNGRKYSAGTVGQTQRGHVQDAYRPDWIWFDDVEDRDSIRSSVITESVQGKIQESIDGLSKDGSFFCTSNYISDQGSIQWLMNKPSVRTRITPLLTDPKDNSSVTWDIYTPEEVEKIKKDAEDFYGEYQCDPKRSENKFFDIDMIEKDMKTTSLPIKESAGVKYWVFYQPHHRYGQGSDHSMGIGFDSNTLVGFDFTTGEQVYSYANNQIAPDLATYEFARIGAEYGNCVYAPEVNSECGGIVISTLKHLSYPNIYTQIREEKLKTINTGKLGWETNSKTKPQILFDFRKDYNDGLIKIHDLNILKEMKAYTNKDLGDEPVGLITKHFDLLMATVIAWQMRKYAHEKQTMGSYSKAMEELLKV